MQKKNENPELIVDEIQPPHLKNESYTTFAAEMQPLKSETMLHNGFDESSKQENMLHSSLDEHPKCESNSGESSNQETTMYPEFDEPSETESWLRRITDEMQKEDALQFNSDANSFSFTGRDWSEDTIVFQEGRRNSMSNPIQQSDVDLVVKSNKLADELEEAGHRLKHREDNIGSLLDRANKLNGEIFDTQIAVGHTLTTGVVKGNDDIPVETEDVIINNILKHKNTAAAIFCQMTYKTDMSQHSLIKDVVGVVATLATTDDSNLSRVLAEFLGQKTMMSLVCRTREGVKALESYNKDGSIDKTSGVHAFAANMMDISLDGRIQVICLDELRPYPGKFIAGDPHKGLDLVRPIVQRQIPSGFLGFAVNMISIDSSVMNCTSKAGNTLRETLFYNLFSSLQVYRSSEEMLKVTPFISNGAVSLDGGVLGRDGVFLDHRKRDVDVMFPIRPSDSIHSYENEDKLKNAKWRINLAVETLQREHALLDEAKSILELKKQEFVEFLTEQEGK